MADDKTVITDLHDAIDAIDDAGACVEDDQCTGSEGLMHKALSELHSAAVGLAPTGTSDNAHALAFGDTESAIYNVDAALRKVQAGHRGPSVVQQLVNARSDAATAVGRLQGI